MNIITAARNTKRILDRDLWSEENCRVDLPDGFYHIQWMLDGIILCYIQHEKAHRWLGWAQACICIHQGISLDQMKQINKDSANYE